MATMEVLVLRKASPSSVAVTFELLDTANRIRAAAGRPAAFQVRTSGSGARAARAYFAGASTPAPDGPAKVLVVPGLGLPDEAALTAALSRSDAQAARRRLIAAAAEGAEIASSCSAVFLTASAGLLDGRRATTSWWLSALFRRLYPAVKLEPEAMVITDGGMTTAGAALAQVDLMLSLIARHADRKLAERCARYMLLEQRTSQARYMAISFLAAADERIGRAERWARKHLEQGFSVELMADAAGLTPRTFARRLARVTGLSPVQFLQRLRVERAVELLETTRLTLDEIASRVGYAEPSTLRRLLRRDGVVGARKMRAA